MFIYQAAAFANLNIKNTVRPINQEQHDHARNLFFQSGKTRAQIAEAVGVSERTITLWTKAGDWKRLRSASKLMPSLIVENFYSQIQELNEDIRNREPGKRYPSMQEAEIFRKLTVTAERIRKGHTQGEYAEMIQKFMSWLTPQNDEHLKLFTTYADRFLKSRSPDGFAPYDIEYSAIELPLPPQEEPATPPLRGGTSESTTVDSEQGDVQLSLVPQPDQGTEQEITEEAPPPFLGEVPGGGRGQLAQDTPTEHNNTSLSLGEGWGEATLAQEQETIEQKRELSPGHQQEIISQRPEITGNNSDPSYETTSNISDDIEEEKREITQQSEKKELSLEHKKGNNEESEKITSQAPPLFLGEVPDGGRGQLAKEDQGVEIGYLGIKQKPEPGGGVMIEIQQSDPDIQKFSIGEAIYYVRKKQ